MVNMNDSATYLPPTVTVDAICFSVLDGRLQALLIQRSAEPLKHRWALPGGYVARGETTQTALDRILRDKAGVAATDIQHLEQLYTFDWVGDDPRGHAVTVTYMALCSGFAPDAAKAHEPTRWFDVEKLPQLAFDHIEFITLARKRLSSKLQYTNIAFGFLPELFSLAQLQQVYEAILGVQVDKRNFRKKLLAIGMLSETGQMTEKASHRPARLYRFKQTELAEIQQFLG